MTEGPLTTPDFRHYPRQPQVVAAVIESGWVRVTWGDGQQGRFHFIWLRDNAADARSIDADSRERLFDILDIPADIAPQRVETDADGALVMVWDEQIVRYHPGWLRAYCYDLGVSDERRQPRETWDSSLGERLPWFNADAIGTDPDTRLRWLKAIRRYGIALVDASPIDPAAYIEWLESLLLIRDMNWGKHFDVVYESEGAYISNKGVEIPPHNDAATRVNMPGIQAFHCVANSVEGGESYWVDGFHVAETLRREDPVAFELLSTITWSMANRNRASEYFCRAPIIQLDRDGDLLAIRHTHWLREPLLIDFDRIEPVYRAYRRFVEIAGDESSRVHHRLRPGEVSFIDNRRVLHAREPYTTGQGQRHMQVSHSEREEVDSAIAVLEREAAGRHLE